MFSLAPQAKHFQVNATNPECAFGEAFYCEVLEILFEKFVELLNASATYPSTYVSSEVRPFRLESDVFFIAPPDPQSCH